MGPPPRATYTAGMRCWVVLSTFAWACGCSESTTDVQRSSDVVRDGGGGGAHASTGGASNTGGGNVQTGGRISSGGRSGAGGQTTGSGGGGTGVAGTGGAGGAGTGGNTPTMGGAGAGGQAIRDAGSLPDAGQGGACRALPREAPDSSLFCTAIICKVANGWEIVLDDPRGFYVGHLFWLLRIGDQVFPETRYVGGGLTNLAFAITDQQFAGLVPGERLLAAYGMAPPLDAATPTGRGSYCGDFERP
jgi:hypothetical protein